MEAAVDDADERDDAAVLVVGGVEDERARRRVRVALWRRIRSTIASSTSSTPSPVFAEMRKTRSALSPTSSATSSGGRVRVRLRKVDLVHDRDDLQVVLDRQVGVRERLRLDALGRVHDEQRALARLERARHLVREVHVARRVDQVQLVALPLDADGLRLDRDPALALEVHRVEHLLAHLALGQVFVSSRMRSASVDLPWSMCATIEKLRMRSRLMGLRERVTSDESVSSSLTRRRAAAPR